MKNTQKKPTGLKAILVLVLLSTSTLIAGRPGRKAPASKSPSTAAPRTAAQEAATVNLAILEDQRSRAQAGQPGVDVRGQAARQRLRQRLEQRRGAGAMEADPAAQARRAQEHQLGTLREIIDEVWTAWAGTRNINATLLQVLAHMRDLWGRPDGLIMAVVATFHGRLAHGHNAFTQAHWTAQIQVPLIDLFSQPAEHAGLTEEEVLALAMRRFFDPGFIVPLPAADAPPAQQDSGDHLERTLRNLLSREGVERLAQGAFEGLLVRAALRSIIPEIPEPFCTLLFSLCETLSIQILRAGELLTPQALQRVGAGTLSSALLDFIGFPSDGIATSALVLATIYFSMVG